VFAHRSSINTPNCAHQPLPSIARRLHRPQPDAVTNRIAFSMGRDQRNLIASHHERPALFVEDARVKWSMHRGEMDDVANHAVSRFYPRVVSWLKFSPPLVKAIEKRAISASPACFFAYPIASWSEFESGASPKRITPMVRHRIFRSSQNER